MLYFGLLVMFTIKSLSLAPFYFIFSSSSKSPTRGLSLTITVLDFSANRFIKELNLSLLSIVLEIITSSKTSMTKDSNTS